MEEEKQQIQIQKVFRNRILFMPKEAQFEINRFLDKGYGADTIRKYIRNNYKEFPVPDLATIRRYSKWYRGDRSSGVVKGQKEEQSGEKDASVSGISLKDRASSREVLKSLLARCLDRLDELAKLDKGPIPTFGLDDKIQKYTKEIRGLIETMTKFRDKLEKDAEVLTKEEFDNELQGILQCVKKVVDKVCPEKANEFAKALEDEIG